VRVWRDSARIWPGEDWRAKIRAAITGDALAFVALFSRASVALGRSRHHEELALGIEQLRSRNPGIPWLFPVRVDGCEIPDLDVGGGRTLRSLLPADLSGPGGSAELARLAASVSRVLDSGPDRAVVPGAPAYLRQVRRIAPPVLQDRGLELAELDAEIAALSSAAAATLVTLMTTDGWDGAKKALAGLWRRRHPDQAQAVEADLDVAHADARAALAAGDEQALADLVAEWRARLSALLAGDAALATELRRLIEDLRLTAGGAGRVVMRATARDQSRVYQAGRDQTVNGG
jgi:hypothetical protein